MAAQGTVPAGRPPAGVTIRAMVRADLPRVVALERQAYTRPWSPATFRQELDRGDDRRYVVAVRDGEVVGYAGVQFVVDEAHVTTVVVAPGHRRSGIATALVAEVLRTARERGAQAATLEVRVGNAAAIALYRRFGFAPVGVRRGYYPPDPDADDPAPEDALILWLHGLQDDARAATLCGRPDHGGR